MGRWPTTGKPRCLATIPVPYGGFMRFDVGLPHQAAKSKAESGSLPGWFPLAGRRIRTRESRAYLINAFRSACSASDPGGDRPERVLRITLLSFWDLDDSALHSDHCSRRCESFVPGCNPPEESRLRPASRC